MLLAIKTTEISSNHVPNLKQVPQVIEMQMEQPNSFIEETKKIENQRIIDNKEKRVYEKPLELRWENISIQTIPKGNCRKSLTAPPKNLLSNVSGSVKTGEALAIIGGSGAGKTTLLNFLSKKIQTDNLTYNGRVFLNDREILDTTNKRISSDKSNISPRTVKKPSLFLNSSDLEAISSYVMQDDILEATMTPQEILLFTAKLKLNLPEIEIEKRVHRMLSELNLQNCKHTRIGNHLIRGVSGGERKRTSIGVELIGDPEIVFLDEPTTGLDSYNAYEVVGKICELAKEEGKIIIFTIHQPSSEIFQLLDKIFILADGKTVYYGPSNECINFFTEELKISYPPNYNPFEFFIERTNMEVLFNKEIQGIKPYGDILLGVENKNDKEKQNSYSLFIELLSDIFAGRKKILTSSETKDNFIVIQSKEDDGKEKVFNMYSERNTTERVFTNANNEKIEDIKDQPPVDQDNIKDFIDEMISEKKTTKGFIYEFSTLFGRNTILSTRNKKILFLKVIQTVFTGILLSILFKNITKNFSGIQDRAGIVFLNIMINVFGATSSTILIFAEERKVYLRERSNKLYSVLSYFMAKTLCELPIYFISVNCFIAIIYPSINLNDTFSGKYYAFIGIVQLLSITGASYAFFLGSMVSNQEALTNLNSAFSIPLSLLSGFFANQDNFAPYMKVFEYFSVFKYGFQILTEIEYTNAQPLNCWNNSKLPCNPMVQRFNFREALWVSCMLIAILIMFFKTIAFISMYLKSKMKG